MVRNLLLMGIATLLALMGAEVICRVAVPAVGWRQFEDVGLGWSSAEYQAFDPLREPKQEHQRRLLFLGDSFLAGAGVSRLGARFPSLIGKRLGENVAVSVLASGGWGTDQELLAFVQKGVAWRPDVVFLAFCANNDLANILANEHIGLGSKPYFVRAADGSLRLYTTQGIPADFTAYQAQRPQVFQSYLLDMIRYQLSPPAEEQAETKPGFAGVDPRYTRFDVREERPDELWRGTKLSWSPESGVNHVSAYIHEDFETNRYQWQLLEGILVELKRATDAAEADLVVLLLPATFRPRDVRFVAGSDYERRYETPDGGFTYRAAEPRDRLRGITQRLGIELYDPTAEFIEIVRSKNLEREAWPDLKDRHFSDVGHAIVADLMVKWMDRNGGGGVR